MAKVRVGDLCLKKWTSFPANTPRKLAFEITLDLSGLVPIHIKLLRHGFLRKIGDVAQHPRDGQTLLRLFLLLVILSIRKTGVSGGVICILYTFI